MMVQFECFDELLSLKTAFGWNYNIFVGSIPRAIFLVISIYFYANIVDNLGISK
jgi:hypothetical protein